MSEYSGERSFKVNMDPDEAYEKALEALKTLDDYKLTRNSAKGRFAVVRAGGPFMFGVSVAAVIERSKEEEGVTIVRIGSPGMSLFTYGSVKDARSAYFVAEVSRVVEKAFGIENKDDDTDIPVFNSLI